MCGHEEDGAGVPYTPPGWPTGFDAYGMIAQEMDVPPEQRREVLASLDPEIVALAKEYAKRAHRRWPPRPRGDGWNMTISSW